MYIWTKGSEKEAEDKDVESVMQNKREAMCSQGRVVGYLLWLLANHKEHRSEELHLSALD